MVEYSSMTMKDIDALRAKVRETGSEAHVVKNTLLANCKAQNTPMMKKVEGSTAVGFAFNDPPALAKVMTDFQRVMKSSKLKAVSLEIRP